MEIFNVLCVEKMCVYLVSYSHEKNKRAQHYNLNVFNCKDQEKGLRSIIHMKRRLELLILQNDLHIHEHYVDLGSHN